MIQYEGSIYRPPSEAQSLILQATVGCSHNQCAFCIAYQEKPFRVRPEADLFKEIDWAACKMPETRRVFLADGDALVLSTDRLLRILEKLFHTLPSLERVTTYGSPQNFLHKSVKDLRQLREAGLTMVYYGIESGDDDILRRIHKGATSHHIIAGGLRSREAGMDLSATVILGLGGPTLSAQHAETTAHVLNAIAPRYASALTLMLEPRSPSHGDLFGEPAWRVLTPPEILAECRHLLANIRANGIIFRSNHASNYLSLAGDLQPDKPRLLAEIDAALKDPTSPRIRPEQSRRL
ncbi:MAG: B12-binding domain-containing radical SAM protein [Planctomycetes bacterium]|nr:B12-binding domain-containing radical SAM protein [Planctomycetota bacterium]